MSPRLILSGAIAVLVVTGLIVAFRPRPPAETIPSQATVMDPLTAYRGSTVLLVLGMPGCPGTEKITAFLASYAAMKPAQVELLRIDVPPPGATIDETAPWSAAFPRRIDHDRAVARQLDFFSYPTFYVIDRDGAVRFSGPFEQARIESMVAEITAEQPGGVKRMFSPPMPAIGSAATGFTGRTLDGAEVTLQSLLGRRATLLFFGSTTCPFSRQATASLPALVAAHADQGFAVAIINQSQKADDIRGFYAGQDVPVVVDADSTISLGGFGVWAVPFCYVLDGEGKVLARQPYTAAAGQALVAKALGLSHEVLLPQAGAG